ncbi:glycosyltransferase family 2 protein [Candidatus Peribacteria bacterium]|nr:glycosyltransferase family 2 protein [Candidatus Peribacteria bacterium]MBT4021176.1 glycosyltransferase family 2 protein [Candidatus Peribacteria bacterium]MBT4240952.1 glycosyltransferase family 2 protein [Candidatus Peribacteria bacterium]MBT4474595.1 glycosyltransferase family 2 protein [Candidatus Peribacteria bacterium]
MLHNNRIIVVMPAYNAEATLEATYRDIPHDVVDEIILVDDCSKDNTVNVANRLGIKTVIHTDNLGYGANQKTCYKTALEHGADIVVMVHPDYQYDPHLVIAICAMIVDGPYDAVIASRILGGHALRGGMPIWKYFANRFLTGIQNLLLWEKLSEYHTGYRAFSRDVLKSVNFQKNSNDFIFDNQMLSQIFMKKFFIGEVSCPTKYFPEASSINFIRCIKYGFGVIFTSLRYRLHKMKMWHFHIFS